MANRRAEPVVRQIFVMPQSLARKVKLLCLDPATGDRVRYGAISDLICCLLVEHFARLGRPSADQLESRIAQLESELRDANACIMNLTTRSQP